jgi:hypothetical protein
MDYKPSIDGMRPRRDAPGAPPVPNNTVPSLNIAPTETVGQGGTGSSSEALLADMKRPGNQPINSDRSAPDPALPHRNRFMRLLSGYWHHKLWTLPLTLLVVAAALLAVPASRYPILAQAGMKRQYNVTVTDSKTDTPVSGAEVAIDGKTAETDSAGRANLTAGVGKHVMAIRKKYYQDASVDVFVGIKTAHNVMAVQVVATGRQVPLVILDKITGKGVAEASIKVLDTETKTDAKGMATVVLPTKEATQPATVTADGYNETNVNLQVTDKVVAANTFTLTPAGRIYFLSNQSGNIDVVSANLDGTGRKTVLAGTGNEDPNNTFLLASRDWTNLALLSKRDDSKDPKLYLITAKDGKLTTIDSDASQITLVGWSDHVFVYQAYRYNIKSWQAGQSVLKSYDADSNKLATIDQSSAAGTEPQYIHQSLAFVNIVGSRVVYGFAWDDVYGNYAPNNLGGQKNDIMSANVNGSNKQTLREIPITNGITYSYMTSVLSKPQVLYIQTSAGAQPAVYYTYQYSNNSVTQSDILTDSTYQHAQASYTTYLISPTDKASFWDQPRDGKNTLFAGDYAGGNGKQIGQPDAYSPYGWYTDDYLLVQKGDSELYIMPAAGGAPLKLSDYYKPPHSSLYGYGGGYGGL